jgi:hypothetical protein
MALGGLLAVFDRRYRQRQRSSAASTDVRRDDPVAPVLAKEAGAR